MSEKIPFVDRFGDAFKTATLIERNFRPAGHRLARFTSGWRLSVTVAAMLVGGSGALAATTLLSANSGQFVSSPGPAPGYKGELLNIGAHNALSVGMRDTRNIAFAPGYSAWHRGVVQVNLVDPSRQGPVGAAVMSTGDLRALVLTAATCSWAHYWVTSMRAKNSDAAATAARQINQAPSLLSKEAVGGIQPNGLGPTIDAIKAGDVNLVDAMIDVGGMIGNGSCTALGPNAVKPAGMSSDKYHAKLAASRQAGEKAILGDPAAEAIDNHVLHSPEMGTALGTFLQRVDAALAAKLAQQAPPNSTRLATRIGEQLLRDHPLRARAPRNTGGARAVGQNPGVGGIVVGAHLLGMSTRDLPKTLSEIPASNTEVRTALKLAQQVFAVDPLAEILDTPPAS